MIELEFFEITSSGFNLLRVEFDSPCINVSVRYFHYVKRSFYVSCMGSFLFIILCFKTLSRKVFIFCSSYLSKVRHLGVVWSVYVGLWVMILIASDFNCFIRTLLELIRKRSYHCVYSAFKVYLGNTKTFGCTYFFFKGQ